jgi:ribosomal protein L37AE/L43A
VAIQVTQETKCDQCRRTTSCRHTGYRWLCTVCWPIVFDTYTMGPGDIAA